MSKFNLQLPTARPGDKAFGGQRSNDFSVNPFLAGTGEGLSYNSVIQLGKLATRKLGTGEALDEVEFHRQGWSRHDIEFHPGHTAKDYENIMKHKKNQRRLQDAQEDWGLLSHAAFFAGGFAAEAAEPLNYLGVGAAAKGASLAVRIAKGAGVAAAADVVKSPLTVLRDKYHQEEDIFANAQRDILFSAAFGGAIGAVSPHVMKLLKKQVGIVEPDTPPVLKGQEMSGLSTVKKSPVDVDVNSITKISDNPGNLKKLQEIERTEGLPRMLEFTKKLEPEEFNVMVKNHPELSKLIDDVDIPNLQKAIQTNSVGEFVELRTNQILASEVQMEGNTLRGNPDQVEAAIKVGQIPQQASTVRVEIDGKVREVQNDPKVLEEAVSSIKREQEIEAQEAFNSFEKNRKEQLPTEKEVYDNDPVVENFETRERELYKKALEVCPI